MSGTSRVNRCVGSPALCVGVAVALASAGSVAGGAGDSIKCEDVQLRASDATAGIMFGQSVAIDEDLIIVGAPSGEGAAYIYRYDGADWNEEAKLVGSDTEADDLFGASVAISEDWAIVGAPMSDGGGLFAGAAYLFAYTGGEWTETTVLQGNTGDRFGWSVAMDGLCAVVGAFMADGATVDNGEAKVFELDEGEWSHVQTLQPSLNQGAWFGYAVSMDAGDSCILVGAPHADT